MLMKLTPGLGKPNLVFQYFINKNITFKVRRLIASFEVRFKHCLFSQQQQQLPQQQPQQQLTQTQIFATMPYEASFLLKAIHSYN